MVKSGKRVKKLKRLDDQVRNKLWNIKDLYSVVRDVNMVKKVDALAELLNRKPMFPLCGFIDQIKNSVENEKLRNNHLTEDEAIQNVLKNEELLDNLKKVGSLESKVVQMEIKHTLEKVRVE